MGLKITFFYPYPRDKDPDLAHIPIFTWKIDFLKLFSGSFRWFWVDWAHDFLDKFSIPLPQGGLRAP